MAYFINQDIEDKNKWLFIKNHEEVVYIKSIKRLFEINNS